MVVGFDDGLTDGTAVEMDVGFTDGTVDRELEGIADGDVDGLGVCSTLGKDVGTAERRTEGTSVGPGKALWEEQGVGTVAGNNDGWLRRRVGCGLCCWVGSRHRS